MNNKLNFLRKVKCAARALLYAANKIPEKRKEELRITVLKFFPNAEELTQEMIEKAAHIEPT